MEEVGFGDKGVCRRRWLGGGTEINSCGGFRGGNPNSDIVTLPNASWRCRGSDILLLKGMTARPKLLVTSRAEKDKPPLPLPGLEFWFRAPYLGDDDKLWRLVEVDAEIEKVVDKPLLGYKEVSVEEGYFISPKSVLRFQVERGEFPHCLSAYRNYVVPSTAFATWADDILGNADFVELLRKADVHRAVMNSLRLDLLWRMWLPAQVAYVGKN
ncbi:hypothetical protein RHGRI_033808 [Rhododendron griersonianum]|uniref:Uncharacterized protein n=1 Tax=Rhododendron griersonianum TaxID=479676 RepID=A0AAV6HY77_9ERIC|nr:hypothetical protein RHGRI_033808 [Rhododendron griersonianum]